MAKISKAKMEANRRWNEKNYFRVALNIPKNWESELKQYAAGNNTTVNKLLNSLIANVLGKESNTSTSEDDNTSTSANKDTSTSEDDNTSTSANKDTSTSEDDNTSTSAKKPPITPEMVAKWDELNADGLSFATIAKNKDGCGYDSSTIARRVGKLRNFSFRV